MLQRLETYCTFRGNGWPGVCYTLNAGPLWTLNYGPGLALLKTSSRRDQCLNVDGLKGEYREMIHKCIHTFPIFSFRICRAALHWCLAMLSYLYDTHTHNLLNKLVLSRRIRVFTLWCACLIIEQHLCWNQCYWLNIKRKNINTVELRAASHDSPYVWKMHEV